MNPKNSIFGKIFFLFFFINLAVLIVTNASYAVEPEEFLKDPKQELRARTISKNVRCLVCQNQSMILLLHLLKIYELSLEIK